MKLRRLILLLMLFVLSLSCVAYADTTENPNTYVLSVERVADDTFAYSVVLKQTAGADPLTLLSVRLECAGATITDVDYESDWGAVVGYANGKISITMNQLGGSFKPEANGTAIATFTVTADSLPVLSYNPADPYNGAMNSGHQDVAGLTVEPPTAATTAAPQLATGFATLTGNTATLELALEPADETNYKVYSEAAGGPEAGEVSLSGTTLTLTFDTAPATAANYYITAKTSELGESARVPFSVFVYTATDSVSLIFPAGTNVTADPVVFEAQYAGSKIVSVEAVESFNIANAFTVQLAEGADSCKIFVLTPTSYGPQCANLVWSITP